MAISEKQDSLHVPLTTPGYHSFWEQEIASKIKSDSKYKFALLTALKSLFHQSLNSFNQQSFPRCSFSPDELMSQDVIIQHQAAQSLGTSESSQHAGDCNSPWRNSVNADLDAILALDSSSVTERETEMAVSDPNTSNSRKSGENVRSKRCKEKNCDFVTYDNNEYWTHKATTHRDVYSYVCPYGHCKFLTKYKHHMNHHQLSKHENVKRFECNYKGCTYRCVTKSMLVSHQKSHWDYYPYQCGTCTYKSKFLNIYKKHLRDNNHQHGIALNRYGIPDPTIVIDIYGTRRGPRQSATATTNHGRDRGLSERLQPMSDNKSAYSIILEAFQSFNLDSSIIEFELLRSRMSKDLPEIHDANSNFGQLQRPSAIDVSREKSMSANIEAFVQDMSAARLVASVIAIKNMSAAGTPLMLPQPRESESTDAPLDLRVSEAARRKDQS